MPSPHRTSKDSELVRPVTRPASPTPPKCVGKAAGFEVWAALRFFFNNQDRSGLSDHSTDALNHICPTLGPSLSRLLDLESHAAVSVPSSSSLSNPHKLCQPCQEAEQNYTLYEITYILTTFYRTGSLI